MFHHPPAVLCLSGPDNARFRPSKREHLRVEFRIQLHQKEQLLPPLNVEQFSALEGDILENGCHASIIVNEGYGHRGRAQPLPCLRKAWPAVQNAGVFLCGSVRGQAVGTGHLDAQKGRRLDKWELGKIALKLKPEIEAKAKGNMSPGGQTFRPSEGAEEGLTGVSLGIFIFLSIRIPRKAADCVPTNTDTRSNACFSGPCIGSLSPFQVLSGIIFCRLSKKARHSIRCAFCERWAAAWNRKWIGPGQEFAPQ